MSTTSTEQPETHADPAPQPAWPAGWYEDPEKNAPYRYYNGERWTDRYRDRPPVSGLVIAGFVICAAVALGAMGTWASIGVFSVNGLDDGRDGTITLVCGALAAIFVWRCLVQPRGSGYVGVLLLGLVVAAVGIYDISQINDAGGEFMGTRIEVAVGWGLWLTAAAGLALTVVGWKLATQARRAKRLGAA